MSITISGITNTVTSSAATINIDKAVAVTGALSATGDATINSLTVGRGAGGVATNTAVGASALAANTTGTQNTAIGQNALLGNTTGYSNVAVGQLALQANTIGINNTATGLQTLLSNTSGSENTAMGQNALLLNTTGSSNVGIGRQALNSNTTASNNTAVGYQAGYSNTTGTSNTFIGYTAGYVSTGNFNTLVGRAAGLALTTGVNNSFIGGYNASSGGSGAEITTGSKNSILGTYNGNQGGLDIRTASNYIVLSDGDGNPRGVFDSSGNLGIGTTSPATYGKLDIYQATDPGTTPSALSVRLVGVGGGSAVPQYGINVDAAQSYNNSTILYGIKVVASQNTGGTTYGLHSSIGAANNAGNSNTLRVAVYGKVNFNSDATHTLATLPVGVYGEVTNITGTTNISTSAAGYFLNSSTLGNTSYGVYIKTTAGPASIVPLRIDHASSELMRLDSSGNLLVGVATANANGGVLQLKSGITFPAVQNASADVNTLDDYEEGTWTGSIAGSTTAGTFTSLTNACSYTKIGRQVTVQYYVQWESGTGTGNLILTGLPFTSRNEAGFYYAGTLSYANVVRTASSTPVANIYHNATQIEYLQIPTIDGDSTSIAYDAAGRLMGMHTYFTA